MKKVTEEFAKAFHESYDLKAKQEGWLITNDSDGFLRIAKVDDPPAWLDENDEPLLDYTEPKFEDDEDAIAFVEKQAEDSLWHTHALRIHESNVPSVC